MGVDQAKNQSRRVNSQSQVNHSALLDDLALGGARVGRRERGGVECLFDRARRGPRGGKPRHSGGFAGINQLQ